MVPGSSPGLGAMKFNEILEIIQNITSIVVFIWLFSPQRLYWVGIASEKWKTLAQLYIHNPEEPFKGEFKFKIYKYLPIWVIFVLILFKLEKYPHKGGLAGHPPVEI